jgi:hypothetical protein
MDECTNDFDGAAWMGTAKNAKNAKHWSKRVDEVCRLSVGFRVGASRLNLVSHTLSTAERVHA